MKIIHVLLLCATVAPALAASSVTRPAPATPVQTTTSAAAIKPSFDCAIAKTRAKLLICNNADLAALDVREAQLLRRAQARAAMPAAVNADQDVWLGQRDACSSIDCLSRAYRRRLRELQQWTN